MKIDIRNIRKKYSRRRILTDISLPASAGEMIGIVGQNGCGKSTLLKILTGVLPADGGEFLYEDGGRSANLLHDSTLRSKVIGYVPQTTPLMDELTAKDNLRLWYTGRSSLKEELEDGVLKRLGVDEFLKTPVYKLSGGMKKRLSIGCAVAHHPKILLLDEPGAALDLVCKKIITDYLNEFCESGGIALIASHEIQEIAACSRSVILKDGILHDCDFDGDVDRLISEL